MACLFALLALFSANLIRTTYQSPWEKTSAVDDELKYQLLSYAGFTDNARQEEINVHLTRITAHVTAGGYLNFTLLTQLFSETDHFNHDWSAFVHVQNSDGLIVAQRDVYLQQGLLATSRVTNWQADHTTPEWLNTFSVAIPDNAYTKNSASDPLQVVIGFYDLKTGERMGIPSWTNTAKSANTPLPIIYQLSDSELDIGTVDVVPHPSALNVPNPMSANFADQVELVGYDVSSLVMHPNQKVTVTLYWRAKQPISADYHVFVHILDPATTTIFGQDDSMPAAWSRPTHTWQPGEIVKDEHTFTIRPDAALGTWQIEVGLYNLDAAGRITRLRLYTPDGGDANDQVYLSRVLIRPDYRYF